MVACFTEEERAYRSAVDVQPLITSRGWSLRHVLVMDLQTGEAAMFLPGGCAPADLRKHRIWVCPLFEPFLAWLYAQDLAELDKLPPVVNLDAAPLSLFGWRRPGVE